MRTQIPSDLLAQYLPLVAQTDRLPKNDPNPVLLGLFGEVGSLLAAAKKLRREQRAFVGYRRAVEEELGDVLWYLAALCRRSTVDLADVFSAADDGLLPGGKSSSANARTKSDCFNDTDLDSTLLHLGESTANLIKRGQNQVAISRELKRFAAQYLVTIEVCGIDFAQVIRSNDQKVRGRFLEPDLATLPTFDEKFAEDEQLPQHFEIEITQRKSGQCYLRWNGVFIGDPLTDNIMDQDGYRFHDVFHFAHAAILHWSPTFRGLIKQKRKSDPIVDENQDGGRASVVEEGLTAWIFSVSKELNYFEGHSSVSFDLLKTVKQFVSGYEVDQCPLSLWERAILQGYAVFRRIRSEKGGSVVILPATFGHGVKRHSSARTSRD